MCGIFGLIDKDTDLEKARLSLNTLSHRGPDQWGEYFVKPVYLGHRRLSIIDLSENGRQPMQNDENDVVITVNGEIYNYKSVREELINKYHFSSDSDSEVILHGYREYGIEGLLSRIDGMFAFSIYDKKKGKLFLVRDRVGIKPLFYGSLNGIYIWGSELKAIEFYLHGRLETDNTAIYDYLTYLYIPQPKTMYKNVFKLQPAHYLEIDLQNNRSELKSYWDIKEEIDETINVQEAAEHLRFLIAKSVKEQLMSDVPVGFFLSGGIDSSIVVYEASGVTDECRTFTIDFSDQAHSEAIYARTVAKLCNTRHNERKLSEVKALELILEMAGWYDEPFADTSALPSFLVSQFARENVTVALSGDGGDELFGGYLWYSYFEKYSHKFPGIPVNRLLIDLKNRFRYRLAGKISNRLLNYNLSGRQLYVKLLGGMLDQEKKKFRKELGICKDYDDYWYFGNITRTGKISTRDLQLLDFKTYLPDDILTKVDRVSMAVALEVRVPLLSRDLVEFTFSLPEEILLYQNQLKGLVKYAYKNILPDEIIFRKKRGFNIPVHKWDQIYSNTSKNMAEVLIDKVYRNRLHGL